MKEIPGKGPGTIGTWQRSNKRSKLSGWQRLAIWPFSARHNRLNAKRRRLISRYPYASRSYGKSERVLGLPEAAGRRTEGRVSGKSARSEAERAKRRRRGRLL
jgi:hypothetical protein